jgi:pimeloyl-ACP methyl ester carboxylesterase
LWRLAILPGVGVITSFTGIAQASLPGLAAAGWTIALLAGLPLGRALGLRRGVRRLEDGRLEMTGGWFMLVFGLSIFAARYALGVLFGVVPALKAEPLWILVSGGVGGLVAGIGIGWLAGVYLRTPGTRIRRAMVGLWVGSASLVLAIAAAFGAVIAFSAPGALPRLAAGDSLPGVESWNRSEIPKVERVAARDGAPLTYRLYPGAKDRAVVLVHGSSGASISVHKLAQALQAEGATVYSISLRGHGGSGTTNGDTSYKRQLDDDLVDFVQATGLSGPQVHRTLMGFSSGGGFVLRTASGPNRAIFDDYLAISPFIAQDSPTSRPASGGWASVAVPRVVALSILDGFGLPWFQGLPVVRFATAAEPSASRTPVYSFRLSAGLQLVRDWRGALAGIDRPTMVVVGAKDELFYADRYKALFAELNPGISVTVEEGFGHLDMSTDPRACAAVARLWRQLVGEDHAARQRFDFKVREDMFAGMDGDRVAFDRAMKLIAATLAAEGVADMARAVELAPNAVAVRVPRATGLLPFARGLRPFDRAEADRLTTTAIRDLEFVVSEAAPRWSTLGQHGRGELLGALADGWLQLGNVAKADAYLDRVTTELPGTPYARNAELRRADPAARVPLTCLGCH